MEKMDPESSAPKRYLVDGEYRTEAEVKELFEHGTRDLASVSEKTRNAVRLLKRFSGRLLDIGCHAGWLVHHLSETRPDLDAYGIDYFEDYIGIAHLLYPEIKEKFRVMNVYSMDFPDGHFDVVTNIDLIEHLDAPLDALKEIRRVLKDRGVLITSTPNLINLSTIKTNILLEYYNRARLRLKKPTRLGYDIFFENEEWNRHIYSWTPQTLNTLLREAGFGYVHHTVVGGGLLARLIPGLARELTIVSEKRPDAKVG
jgi:2-polyprenyl-3-methyl-5-hydroxy-6-metoxy-1,4-benzoquinol methylase